MSTPMTSSPRNTPLPMTPQKADRASYNDLPSEIPRPDPPRRHSVAPTYCVPAVQTTVESAPQPETTVKTKHPRKKALYSSARIAPEEVPRVINVKGDFKDEKTVLSNVTMPKALRPSKTHKKAKTASVQETLFSQVLKEEQEKISTVLDSPTIEDVEPYMSKAGNPFPNILGLAPEDAQPRTHLVEVAENDGSLCDPNISGSAPAVKSGVFRRFHGQVVAGFHSAGTKLIKSSSSDEPPEKDDTLPPSAPSPRPSPRRTLSHSKSSPVPSTPTRAKKPFLLERILPSPRTSNNASFLPRHLSFAKSEEDDEDSFFADLTTQAVGSVLSAALDIPEDEETRNDCRSESHAESDTRDEGTEHCSDVDLERLASKDEEEASYEEFPSSKDSFVHDKFFHGIHVVNVPVRKHVEVPVTFPKGTPPNRFINPSISCKMDEEAAIPSDHKDNSIPSNHQRPIYTRVWCWILMILVVACVAGGVAGVLLGLARNNDNRAEATAATEGEPANDSASRSPSLVPTSFPTFDPSNSPSNSPTPSPTLKPTVQDNVQPPTVPSRTPVATPAPTTAKNFAEKILESSPATQLAFLNPNSPQSRALTWLQQHTVQLADTEIIQRFALATMFYSLNETQSGWNHNDAWLSHSDSECSWFGVSCNIFEQVSIVNLNFNNLGGTLAKEVSMLSNLRVLSLGGGTGDEVTQSSVIGTIPASWGDLVNLETLELHDNMLTGAIPDTFGQLTKLKTLRLYRNSLSSNIPTALGNLQKLEIAEMSSNRFTGQLPTELGRLTSLTSLALARNRFHGGIPSEIGYLSSVTQLYLNGNTLSGLLPNELWGLSSLSWISLYNNDFQGTLPSEIGQLVNAEGIQLHGNQLEGSIPLQISKLGELRVLDLSNNHFNGTVASPELQSLSKLAGLYLHENDLDGDVPQVICDLMNFELRQLWTDCSSQVTCQCCTKCF